MSERVLATNNIDLNVKIPAAVKAVIARSEEVHRQAYNTPAPATEETTEKTTDGQPATIKLEGTPPAAEQPAASVTTEVTPPPTNDQAEPNDQTWKHRFLSSQGRLDRANEQIRTMSDQMSRLQAAVTALQTRREAEPEPEQPRLVSQQEEDEYGSELLSVVAKKAQEVMAPLLKKQEQEIAQLKGQVSGFGAHVAMNAHEQMKADLTASVPNWREVNENQKFLDWLALPDPYSGAIRHDMLKAAWDTSNTSRVNAFFKGFLSEEAAVVPRNGSAPLPAGKVPLESFAAPGRAKTAAAGTGPAEKPIIKRSEITAFYNDAAAGKYIGREAEYAEAEAILNAAIREGRIQ